MPATGWSCWAATCRRSSRARPRHLPPVLLGRGTSEEWYDAAKMEHDVELLRGQGVDVRPFVFQGGHEWTNEFRAAAGGFLDEVLQPAS